MNYSQYSPMATTSHISIVPPQLHHNFCLIKVPRKYKLQASLTIIGCIYYSEMNIYCAARLYR